MLAFMQDQSNLLFIWKIYLQSNDQEGGIQIRDLKNEKNITQDL